MCRMFARLRSAAFAALAGFHAVLLWQRFVDGTILEPAVLAKYVASLLLLVAARFCHHLIPAHLLGRRSQMVFWLVVVLLHAVSPSAEIGEITAIIEISLGLPLAIAIARATLIAPPRRILHRASETCNAPRSFRERVPLPARAPPFSR
jgi:hypothetical protein